MGTLSYYLGPQLLKPYCWDIFHPLIFAKDSCALEMLAALFDVKYYTRETFLYVTWLKMDLFAKVEAFSVDCAGLGSITVFSLPRPQLLKG